MDVLALIHPTGGVFDPCQIHHEQPLLTCTPKWAWYARGRVGERRFEREQSGAEQAAQTEGFSGEETAKAN